METLEGLRLYGTRLVDFADLTELFFRLVIDLLFSFIILRFVYYRFNKHKEFLFTFMLFNLTIFFICALLRNVQISMGFAFGLFALFGILRYRTETIPIKEMTYLFVFIAIAMINSIFSRKISYAEFISTNIIIVILTYLFEKIKLFKRESFRLITYEKIDMIKPENKDLLIEDIKKRTGLNIQKVEVDRINFLRDTARLKIFYIDDTRK